MSLANAIDFGFENVGIKERVDTLVVDKALQFISGAAPGFVLSSDGLGNASWVPGGGGGGVTSVSVSDGTLTANGGAGPAVGPVTLASTGNYGALTLTTTGGVAINTPGTFALQNGALVGSVLQCINSTTGQAAWVNATTSADDIMAYGTSGQAISGGTVTLNLTAQTSLVTSWTIAASALVCGASNPGVYSFQAFIPLGINVTNPSGIVYAQFFRNGVAMGPQAFFNVDNTKQSSVEIFQFSCQTIISCSPGDSITIRASTGTAGFWFTPDPGVTGANAVTQVLVTRLR